MKNFEFQVTFKKFKFPLKGASLFHEITIITKLFLLSPLVEFCKVFQFSLSRDSINDAYVQTHKTATISEIGWNTTVFGNSEWLSCQRFMAWNFFSLIMETWIAWAMSQLGGGKKQCKICVAYISDKLDCLLLNEWRWMNFFT